MKDINEFNVKQLRCRLTKDVLNGIDFPYTKQDTRSRQTEIIEWLKMNPVYKTMDVQLLRQRIFNYFILHVQDMVFTEQETLDSFIPNNLKFIKNLKSHN